MSYLSNNPFQRPTPNFSNNINTFNTYSSNDYVGMAGRGYGSSAGYGSSYGFGTGPSYGSTGGYFGANNKGESAEYKYARNVQTNPFSTGANPFAGSTANPFSASNVSASNYNDKPAYNQYQPSNKYSRPSYNSYGSSLQNDNNVTTSYSRKEYSYEPRISNTSGFTDPYQDSYFKNDKYDDHFRKSNFEMDFEIEIGKSRENMLDQKYKTGTKETQISKILQSSPFHKPNINSQVNKYSPNTIQNPYTSPHKKYDQYDSKDSYLATSNVKPVSGFGVTYQHDQFNSTSKDYLKDNQIYSNTKSYQIQKFQFNSDKVSQKDSGNTFINKFDDIISDKTDEKNNQKRYSQNKKNPQQQLENPFIRNSNPFMKSDKLSVKSPTNSQLQNKKITSEYDFKISASGGSSSEISLGDFEDIEKKKSLTSSVQEKYDKYIFRRSSDGSKKASNYDQKVDEKFDLWQKESSRKSQKYFDAQNIDKQFQFDDFGRKSKQSVKNEKVMFKNIAQDKESLKNVPVRQSMTQKMEMKQSYGNKNAFSFMKQSTEKSLKDETENYVQKNNKSLTQYEFNPNKNSKVFQFSGQNFTDQDQTEQNDIESQFQRNRREIEDGLKKISEVSMSQQRESEPNFSKKPSMASLNQNNTEQKIDEKLEKYRYNYDKKPILQNQTPKINDFIDINLNDEEENGIFSREQSSFRQVSPTEDEEQVFQNGRKRNNLKEKIINGSKKLIQVQNQIKKDSKPTPQQNPLNQIHQRLQTKILTLKKEVQAPKNTSQQRYEFQALQEFEQKYQYDMKGSEFDFDDDSFEETEKNLGIEEEDNLTKSPSFNKVLSPQFGFHDEGQQKTLQKHIAQRDIFEPQIKHPIQPVRSYISSISSNSQRPSHQNKLEENQDFVPTFKMKDSLNLNDKPQSEIRRSSHKPIISQDAKPIMSSVREPEKKKQNIQQKVQRMKIYESQNQNQSHRSSGQYEPYIFGNGRQSSRKQSIKLFENDQNEEENVCKSPFEKKLQIIEPKRSSKLEKTQKIQISLSQKQEESKKIKNTNQYEYQSSRRQQNSWGSSDMLYRKEFNKKEQQENEEIYLSEQNLKETKKYNNNFTLYQQNCKEQPVRDSFELVHNKKLYEKSSKKQIIISESLKRQPKRKFPSTLQFKGNIYHFIQLVQN